MWIEISVEVLYIILSGSRLARALWIEIVLNRCGDDSFSVEAREGLVD